MAPIHMSVAAFRAAVFSLSVLRTWDYMFCGLMLDMRVWLSPPLDLACPRDLPRGKIKFIHSIGLARTNVARHPIIDVYIVAIWRLYTIVSQPAEQRVSVLM